jgi:hypothetical protein
MRASKKTAQGLSGANAYSRLPFVSPVRDDLGIPEDSVLGGKGGNKLATEASDRTGFPAPVRGSLWEALGGFRPGGDRHADRHWALVSLFWARQLD